MRDIRNLHDFDYDEGRICDSLKEFVYDLRTNKKIVISNEGLIDTHYQIMVANRLCALQEKLDRKVKIIIGIRNQFDYIYSMWKQSLQGGGGTLTFAQRFLENGEINPYNLHFPKTKYDKITAVYFDLFGEDNVLVMLYEHLICEPSEFFGKLNDFMCVPHFGSVINHRRSNSSRRTNTNLSYSELAGIIALQLNKIFSSKNNNQPILQDSRLSRLVRSSLSIPNHKILNLRSILQDSRLSRLVRWISMKSDLENRKQFYKEKYQFQFVEYYNESNERLSRMLNLDLKSFGYPML